MARYSLPARVSSGWQTRTHASKQSRASGKSNLRDAFRFLHGIGRGYNLAEIIGQKWGEEGVLLWRGIRGGVREAAFYGTNRFRLTVKLSVERDQYPGRTYHFSYSLEV